MPALLDVEVRDKWSRAGADYSGPWAPIPITATTTNAPAQTPEAAEEP